MENKKIIDEALSKVMVEALDKIKTNLVEIMGLNKFEATYIIEFYKKIREMELINTNYFKNFEYEGELIDFSDAQRFTNETEAFYDMVMVIMHNKAFTAFYDISFDGVNVTLTKKVVEEAEEKSFDVVTPFDEFRIAEDENYYTFIMTNPSNAKELRKFYAKMYPEDPDIKRMDSFFFSSWCIASSSADSYFHSQKHNKDDIWLVTYRKGNPAERLREKYGLDTLYNRTNEINHEKNQLGEVYLMKSDGSLGTGYNYGYHNYYNSPGSGIKHSDLEVPVSYNYGSLDVSSAGVKLPDFDITDGELEVCRVNEKVVVIPEGITSIKSGAFKGLKNVMKVVLPMSLKTIHEKAFVNMSALQYIFATNNLEVVNPNAFKSCYYVDKIMTGNGRLDFYIGVFDESEEGTTYFKKPSQLRFMPKFLLKAYKDAQKADEVQEERNGVIKAVLDESFRAKRDRYEQTDLYSIFKDILYLDADWRDARNVKELVIPEGIVAVKGRFGEYTNIEKLVLPSSISTFTALPDMTLPNLVTVDISKSNVRTVPPSLFKGAISLEEIIGSEKISEIGSHAFDGSGLERIKLNDMCSVIPNAFKNCPFMEEIIVKDLSVFTKANGEQVVKSLQSLGITMREEH